MSGGQTANPGAVTRLPGCPIAKIAEESPVLTGGRGRAFGLARALYSPAEFLDSALAALRRARCLLESGEPEQLALIRDTLLGPPPGQRAELLVQVALAPGQAAAARYPDLPAVDE